MSQSITNQSLPTHKEYCLSPVWRTTLNIIGLGSLSIPFWLLVTNTEIIGGTIVDAFVISFPLGGAALIGANGYRLVVSSKGIEYRAPLRRVSAVWDNIEHAVIGDAGQPDLVLRQPDAAHKLASIRFLARFNLFTRIPLGSFMWAWHTGLENDLRQYAPHLFLEDAAIAAANPQQPKHYMVLTSEMGTVIRDPNIRNMFYIYLTVRVSVVIWMIPFSLLWINLFIGQGILVLLLMLFVTPFVLIPLLYVVFTLAMLSSVLFLRFFIPKALIRDFLAGNTLNLFKLNLPESSLRWISAILLRDDHIDE